LKLDSLSFYDFCVLALGEYWRIFSEYSLLEIIFEKAPRDHVLDPTVFSVDLVICQMMAFEGIFGGVAIQETHGPIRFEISGNIGEYLL